MTQANAKSPSKPSGGIKIIRANPAATATATGAAKQLGGLTLNGPVSPKTPTSPTCDSLWEQMISSQGGTPEAAATALSRQLAAGDKTAAKASGGLLRDQGLLPLLSHNIFASIKTNLTEDVPPLIREAALTAYTELAKCGIQAIEPFLIPLLPAVVERSADRLLPIRRLAEGAGKALIHTVNPHAASDIIDLLKPGLGSGNKWQSKAAALSLINLLAERAPSQVAHIMLDVVPILSEAMVEPQPEVAKAAHNAMLAASYTAGNRDLDPHIPSLVSCIGHPEQVAEVVGKLSATTFVQTIEDAALAVMVPLLVRALRESTTVKRRAAVIVINMSKMVQNAEEATPFLPLLIPGFKKVKDEAADPDLREMAGRAYDALVAIEKAAAEQGVTHDAPADAPAVLQALSALLCEQAPAADIYSSGSPVKEAMQYVSLLGASLIRSKVKAARQWEHCIVPYLQPHLEDGVALEIARALQRWAATHMGLATVDNEDSDSDDDGQDELCNCEFSLGYGGRILLMNANLKLKRGRRYGLCGANGVGKTTLMRAIERGQLEGFPPSDVLRTVMVDHDIDSSQAESPITDYVMADPKVKEVNAGSMERVEKVLESVGFDRAFRSRAVSSLSGGWKMKLALARAMLMNADILLLDEPTNHLDVENVQWLQDYLNNSPEISSLIVSHDSGFLDAVCTDIIHYEAKKLVIYKGNLSEFVKKRPEAKSYYELGATTVKFKFPEPGFLDGIKGKTQTILRVQKVGFSYPGRDVKILEDVNVRVTLGSRVAALGHNGAGKSTLIKLMTGEMEPDEGTVWKHPNLRISFVAQHAFHHIEQHLEKTPVQYLWWRFGDGEDKEAANKVTRKLTVAEQAERERAIAAGEKVVEYINSRRMGKGKEYEYEVVYVGLGPEWNEWIPRTALNERGLGKLAESMDSRMAVFLSYRPLTTPAAMAHLLDFGLDEEVAGHNPIKGMSGGQKVKLVLAAACWPQPHLIVLDEPTNYLDRDSLGGLAAAIQEFQGAVVMISHNSEFTSALCAEEWHVGGGKVVIRGGRLPPSSASMASIASSMPSVSSVASLVSLQSTDTDGQELDEEALEAKIKAKQAARDEKVAKAKEKALEKERLKKLRYSKRF